MESDESDIEIDSGDSSSDKEIDEGSQDNLNNEWNTTAMMFLWRIMTVQMLIRATD